MRVTARRSNRCRAASSRAVRSNGPSHVPRTAMTFSSVRADDGTYQARTAVNVAPPWSAQVMAMADQVSSFSPRSTRTRVSPSTRFSSSLPRA